MSSFNGKIIVITGAARGLGRNLAEIFDDSGAIVYALDLDMDVLQAVSAGRSSRFRPLCLDLSSREDIFRTFEQIQAESDSVDILINNAGIVVGKSIQDHTAQHIEDTFAVNTIAHFYTVQAVLPAMIRRNSGHIVTIASAGGFVGAPGMGAYTASKFAAIGFDETLRNELSGQQSSISTTLVAPYFVNTGMFDGVRTRFSWLLPILKQDYVAGRIVKAIAAKKKRLIMPRFVYLVFPLRLLPVGLFDWLTDFFGITRAMDHFRGRP